MPQRSRKKQQNTRPHGELRQSQLLTSYGAGAMVDLPHQSIIIGGLNQWFGYRDYPIDEERLARRVSEILEVNQIDLYAPPQSQTDPSQPKTGIGAFIFPKWFVAQIEETYFSRSGKRYQTRPLIPEKRLLKGKYEDENRTKHSVVPVRFVQACRNGHISDIDWYLFVNQDCRSNCPAQLWLDEGGTGNDFADIFVRCSKCKKRRPLSDATIPDFAALGYCKGKRPWLGENAQEDCRNPETKKAERNRLLVRSASNAYFSQVLSVISLPESDQALRDAVSRVYEDYLREIDKKENIAFCRQMMHKVREALAKYSDEEVWQEVQRRQQGGEPPKKTIKQAEIETLLSADTVGKDEPDSDFYAYVRPLESLPSPLAGKLDKVILVPRLREVIAQVGFTRFEPALPDIQGELPDEEELEMSVRRAPLDFEPKWVPAIEQRGEGIFLSFSESAINEWIEQSAVKERGKLLRKGFKAWCKRRNLAEDKAEFPGLPYIMLHSLSHLLITTVSLKCGYSASAIKERIYAGEGGYGILLYTGSSGSEGTLGGLIEVGKEIEYDLIQALEEGRLCSNDPLCAQHEPDNHQEERFLHGSACHGCLLIAETSCERRNEFLDRALVTETVMGQKTAFFLESP
jgi:hypothetical protein